MAALKEIFSILPLGYFAFWTFIIGSAIGSFLNVVIYRVPRAISIVKPPSHCPVCKKPIRPWNNIPILSYLILRGKCSDCGTKISPRYAIVEFMAGAIGVIAILRFGLTWEALAGMVLGWHLLALSFIDLEHQIVPDHIVLPMAVLGLLFAYLTGSWMGIIKALISASIGGGFILLMWFIGKVLLKKEGAGGGDVTAAAGFALYLPPILVPLALAVSAFFGIILAYIIAVVEKRSVKDHYFPFLPALSLGAWLIFLFGGEVLSLYMNWVYDRIVG